MNVLTYLPRREWDSAIRASAATKLRDLAVQRALFLQQRCGYPYP